MTDSRKSLLLGTTIGIIIALAIVGIVCIMGRGGNGGNGGNGSGNGGNGGDNKSEVVIEKDPIPPADKNKAVKRIIPRKIAAEFAMTGKGKDANWGIAKQANYQYTVCVEAKSEILSKGLDSQGNIDVKERRTFLNVYDSIVVSEADFVLALDTLPGKDFIEVVGKVVSTLSPLKGKILVKGAEYAIGKTLKKVDGKGLRELLKVVCSEKFLDELVNEQAKGMMTNAIGSVRDVSGKTYIIHYTQEESGPLMTEIKREDGEQLTEEEKMVLKRVNAFIDYHFVPDDEFKPGDSWNVYASDMQELFDPFVDGNYSGKIKVSRIGDSPNGDWNIKLEPGTFNVSSKGNPIGYMTITEGNASVDKKNISITNLFVKGTGELKKRTKHHLLFHSELKGAAKFQGRLVTEPLEK